MKPQTVLPLFLIIAWSASAQQMSPSAENEKPPLPDPILRRVTDLTPWKLVFRTVPQTANVPSSSSQSRTTSIIKSKSIYHIVENQPNGPSFDKWCIDGMLVKFPPNTDKWSISTTDINFSQSDFPELPWLSKENYTGVQKINGNDAYIFKTQYTVTDENGQPEIINQTAAVDVVTRWPIYSTNGQAAVIYQYGNPLSTPLSIPAKVSAVIARQKEFAQPRSNR
jgi:hypothetical protein